MSATTKTLLIATAATVIGGLIVHYLTRSVWVGE